MDPATTFCPRLACPARGQTGQGNIGIHARKDKRFLCPACHKTFSATTGTALYRLRTAAETVTLVVTVLAHGCPPHAIVVAFGFDERTVASWMARGGGQGQAVPEYLVEPPRDLGQVQADAIRVNKTPCGRTLRTSTLSSGTSLLRGEGICAPFDHLPLVVDHPISWVPDAPYSHLTLT